MTGGMREKLDCCTYFGTKLKNEDNENIADFLLKSSVSNNTKLKQNLKESNESKESVDSLVFMVYYLKSNYTNIYLH